MPLANDPWPDFQAQVAKALTALAAGKSEAFGATQGQTNLAGFLGGLNAPPNMTIPPGAYSQPGASTTIPITPATNPALAAGSLNAFAGGPSAANGWYSSQAAKDAGFGPWGGPTADGPPAWLAKAALAAYQAGDQKQMQHILDSVNGPDGPQGDLKHHIVNFINGLFAGDADRIKEAKYYSTNPSIGNVPAGIGDGIPGDGM